MRKTTDDRAVERRETAARLEREQRIYAKLNELGETRTELEESLANNRAEILRLIRRSRGDIKVATAARMIGLSRSQLNRWLEEVPPD